MRTRHLKHPTLCEPGEAPTIAEWLVVFVVFRAFVGFLHDIAPSAQLFSDAGKPRLFGGEKPSIWSQISSNILTILSTRSSEAGGLSGSITAIPGPKRTAAPS